MRSLAGQAEPLTGWEQASQPTSPVTAWRPTAEQEHAIARRSEPLLLAAGAGSGKTSVLVERYVRAVCEDGIDPGRILAITFTERAAAELRERVRARLQATGEPAAAARVRERAYVGTFHGFCALLLRDHAREAGSAVDKRATGRAETTEAAETTETTETANEAGGVVETDQALQYGELGLGTGKWEVLDEGLAGRLRRRAFAEALGQLLVGEYGRERADAVDLIAAYGADRARAIVLGAYAQLRSRGQRVPRLPDPELGAVSLVGAQAQLSSPAELQARQALDARAAQTVGVWDELLARFGERYELAKATRGGLDFDDLELHALELLTHDTDVRRAWTERLQLLMVDELQDVNPRQLALVRALERDNLFTVGDAWQSIYGFRHADVSLFREREAQLAPLGQSLHLTHNFRGHAQLLQAVNTVFAPRFGAAFIPLHAGREHDRRREAHEEPLLELLLTHKRGWGGADASPQTGRPEPDRLAAPWREAEARTLAERVAELVRSGLTRPGEVAVLLRATVELECYERALRQEGLRTIAQGGAFWIRQEVVDLLAHLRVLADPTDEVALYGVLCAPPLELSGDALALLADAAHTQGRSVWEVVRDRSFTSTIGHPGIIDLCEWLELERSLADSLALSELLERAIARNVPVDHSAQVEDVARRLANVRKLVELARQWERTEGHDLRGFLDEAAFQAAAGGPAGRLAGSDTAVEVDAPVMDDLAQGPGVDGGGADSDAVRLMSVHAAKGLEFDVVCLADLGRAPSASTPDLLVDGERIGIRMIELEDPEPRPALQFAELALERRDAQAAEEDRIVYVAMTRARERLLLSGAVDFASWPRDRPGGPPIAWLAPALAPELPTLCAQTAAHPAAAPPESAAQISAATGPETAARGATATAAMAADSGAATPAASPAAAALSGLTVDGTDVPLGVRLNMPPPGSPA